MPALPPPPPLPPLPRRLRAPAPGWVETTDVAVVGSGIAGLTTALYLREAGLHVTVVTKVNVGDGSTRWAQGGIAAVLDPGDSPAAHAADTLAAGAGLCDPGAVEVLVTEGPARLRELIRFGADFDRHPDGTLMLTREGGHRTDRVVHAGGDATGAEVQRALEAAVHRDPWIRLIEHALVVDLLTSSAGEVCGLTLHVLGEGTEHGVGAVHAPAVVLATGGIGQIFSATTNPVVSTGDGVALALRAGAAVTDLEFVQFHPTALAVGPAGGPRPLVSEALRGEGAHLVDQDGKRFLVGQHELAELAPRDVVAKASWRVLRETGTDHVFLDARHLGGDFLRRRFPTICAACQAAGIDPAAQLIPVAPAAHYASGGVRTDRHGRTTVPGLYACGEVACTGVHGANRLASNSLLEGLVFARRIASDVLRRAPGYRPESPPGPPAHAGAPSGAPGWGADPNGADPNGADPNGADPNGADPSGADPNGADPSQGARLQPGLEPREAADALQRVMNDGAGVLRSAESLGTAGQALRELAAATQIGPGAGGSAGTRGWELSNLMTVAAVLVAAAYARQESRGCHWRADHPEPAPRWQGHLVAALSATGAVELTWAEGV